MKTLHALSIATAALFAAGNAGALTIIDTRPPNSTVYYFGEPDTATYGQTFTVPLTDTRLESFSLSAALTSAAPTYFAFYVMEWDGTKAVGSPLYSTLQQQISANAAVEYVFSPGITLAPGGSYVAFINASSFFDGHVDQSYVSAVAGADRYTGGEFVYLNNGNDFSRVTVDDWTKTWTDTSGSTAKLNYDLSFEARFSSPGLSGGDPGTRVGDNEFGTFSLLGATLFGFGLLRRKVA